MLKVTGYPKLPKSPKLQQSDISKVLSQFQPFFGRFGTVSCKAITIAHNYIGHSYIGHKYIGHNYLGHNCVGQQVQLYGLRQHVELRGHYYWP